MCMIFFTGSSVLLCFILAPPAVASKQRDPKKWPFAQDSIWNVPIGDQAVYVPAEIREAGAYGMTIDEDVIVLRPDEPSKTTVYFSSIGWSDGSQRCTSYDENRILYEDLPIPTSFIVSPDTWDGLRPNSGLACLLPDGETIVQTQPFAKCESNLATSLTSSIPPVSLFGNGIRGAHGGSGLSAIGGALRVGELVPGGTIRHALKINLFGRDNLYHNLEGEPDGRIGYRWPAIRADADFADPERNNYYGGTNPALQMGSLVALHKDVDLANLDSNSLGIVTEPALILARAFQDYGAYVVDDTAWDVYAIITEWGPDGRVDDEVNQHWGYGIKQSSQDTEFAQDMDRIFLNLFVIDNNGPENVGGGGAPRAPLAPPFVGDEGQQSADDEEDGLGALLAWLAWLFCM